jgi:hypothetical protein
VSLPRGGEGTRPHVFKKPGSGWWVRFNRLVPDKLLDQARDYARHLTHGMKYHGPTR